MKKTQVVCCLLVILGAWSVRGVGAVPRGEQVIVDEIVAIIYHPGGAEIVLRSDVRRALDGVRKSLRDVLLDRLMVVDAQSMNIQISSEDAEGFLAAVQKNNQLTREEMIAAFEEQGFTYQEGLEQLQRRQMIEQIIDLRIRSDKSLVITKQDVQQFDEQHPAFEEAELTMAQAFIPSGQKPRDLAKKKWSAAELDALTWGESFVVKESELADDKKAVVDRAVGELVDLVEVSDGLELTRLVGKKAHRRLTVEERYAEIASKMYSDRFMGLLHAYEDRLLEDAAIRFTYPEDGHEVFEGAE